MFLDKYEKTKTKRKTKTKTEQMEKTRKNLKTGLEVAFGTLEIPKSVLDARISIKDVLAILMDGH